MTELAHKVNTDDRFQCPQQRRSRPAEADPEQTRSTTSLVYPPAFTLATRQDEPQAASKDAPIVPESLKVAPHAGLPLSDRIPNHALPAGLEHRRSLFQHKTSRARFDRAGAAIFPFARATRAHANCRPQYTGERAQRWPRRPLGSPQRDRLLGPATVSVDLSPPLALQPR